MFRYVLSVWKTIDCRVLTAVASVDTDLEVALPTWACRLNPSNSVQLALMPVPN